MVGRRDTAARVEGRRRYGPVRGADRFHAGVRAGAAGPVRRGDGDVRGADPPGPRAGPDPVPPRPVRVPAGPVRRRHPLLDRPARPGTRRGPARAADRLGVPGPCAATGQPRRLRGGVRVPGRRRGLRPGRGGAPRVVPARRRSGAHPRGPVRPGRGPSIPDDGSERRRRRPAPGPVPRVARRPGRCAGTGGGPAAPDPVGRAGGPGGPVGVRAVVAAARRCRPGRAGAGGPGRRRVRTGTDPGRQEPGRAADPAGPVGRGGVGAGCPARGRPVARPDPARVLVPGRPVHGPGRSDVGRVRPVALGGAGPVGQRTGPVHGGHVRQRRPGYRRPCPARAGARADPGRTH